MGGAIPHVQHTRAPETSNSESWPSRLRCRVFVVERTHQRSVLLSCSGSVLLSCSHSPSLAKPVEMPCLRCNTDHRASARGNETYATNGPSALHRLQDPQTVLSPGRASYSVCSIVHKKCLVQLCERTNKARSHGARSRAVASRLQHGHLWMLQQRVHGCVRLCGGQPNDHSLGGVERAVAWPACDCPICPAFAT